jgi:hypothetical protein
LLVTLFVNSALRRARDGHPFDDMPEAVSEIFDDYLRRVKIPASRCSSRWTPRRSPIT